MKEFDIIIAGGGMVGATAALALAQLEMNIALVEPIEPTLDISPSYDQRAVALSAASVAIYKSLNLWDQIQPLASPITDIHISDQGNFGFTRINAKDCKVDALGQVIPLDQTGPILWQSIRSIKNITLFCPAKISAIKSSEELGDPIEIILIDNQKKQHLLSAKLLLAADGTYSSVAKMSSIETTRNSYRQHAVIANITTEKAHNNRAFERFTQQGPLALLPLKRKSMSLVWCQNEENIDNVMNYSDDEFIQQLQLAFGYRLGQITKVGQRCEYPLALHTCHQPFKQRVLLLGNAAHTLHPIAGQGFNLGLRDIAALVDAIVKAKTHSHNLDYGQVSFLAEYLQQRQADWKLTIGATDSLVKLFSYDFFLLTLARDKGLCLLDKIPFLKQKVASMAMGFNGHSANLTRGIKINH